MTTSSPPGPPPLAERALQLAIREPEWREAVAGDLREEFIGIARRHGQSAARRWYWWQALGLGARFLVARVIPKATPRRWRPRDVDLDPPRAWTVARDVAHAWRAVTQRPGVSAAIIGTLALALAANATIFNLADALYLRPFRFPDVDRIAIVSSSPDNDPGADHTSVAPADFRDWERESTTLTSFAAALFWDPNLSGTSGDPERVPGFRVSPAFFRAVGAEPLLGRAFVDSEARPGSDRRVVLSHGLWVRRFGSDPTIVGRAIRFDGEPHEVVGVLRPGISVPYGAQVWVPLTFSEEEWADRSRGTLLVVARLAEGRSLGAARAEMTAIVERQRRAHPATNARRGLTVVSLTRGLADGFAAPILAIWQAAAVLLLVIAGANIANLLLARGTERQQEFAVRLALGAGRWRIARQLMFEGAWLALGAIILTLPLALAGTEALRRGMPPGLHRWVPGIDFIGVDVSALGVAMVLGVVATLCFSWLPALQASRAGVAESLRQGGRTLADGRSRGWLGVGLASGQVALALALVVGAGLVLGGIDRVVNGTLGFDRRHVMTAQVQLTTNAYDEAEQRRHFIEEVMDRLRGIPAVETLAVASGLPYSSGGPSRPIYPEGVELAEAEVRQATTWSVSPSYFEAMRIPLLDGRGFSSADREGTTAVAIVSQAFAERYWPSESPIGRRFRTAADGPWLEIVGMAADVLQDMLMQRGWPAFYRPVAQQTPYSMAFLVRTGNPLDLAGELRRAVTAADPDQPMESLRSMEQVIAERAAGITHLGRALGAMSGVALLLALVGVYSLMAYMASRRTQEFGVRMALGATRSQVVRLSLRQAALVTVCGLVGGTALAVALIRVMAATMFGLVLFDTAAIAVMTAALGATVMIAGWLPAHRAADLDPTAALRAE
jgi:putative ABC transport system permease protein